MKKIRIRDYKLNFLVFLFIFIAFYGCKGIRNIIMHIPVGDETSNISTLPLGRFSQVSHYKNGSIWNIYYNTNVGGGFKVFSTLPQLGKKYFGKNIFSGNWTLLINNIARQSLNQNIFLTTDLTDLTDC